MVLGAQLGSHCVSGSLRMSFPGEQKKHSRWEPGKAAVGRSGEQGEIPKDGQQLAEALYKKWTRLTSGAGEARNAVIFKGHINVEK